MLTRAGGAPAAGFLTRARLNIKPAIRLWPPVAGRGFACSTHAIRSARLSRGPSFSPSRRSQIGPELGASRITGDELVARQASRRAQSGTARKSASALKRGLRRPGTPLDEGVHARRASEARAPSRMTRKRRAGHRAARFACARGSGTSPARSPSSRDARGVPSPDVVRLRKPSAEGDRHQIALVPARSPSSPARLDGRVPGSTAPLRAALSGRFPAWSSRRTGEARQAPGRD